MRQILPSQTQSYLLLRSALGVGLILGSLISAPAAVQGKQQSASLELNAPRRVEVGSPIPITLKVKHAADIAGYEAALLFDTAVAEFAGLEQRQNDLKRIGRDVSPMVVAGLPNGVAFGFYSCATDDCVTPRGPKKGRGAKDTIKLARVILIANAPGRLEIRLDAVKFVDAAGKPVAVELANPVLTVQIGPSRAQNFYPAPAGLWTLPADADHPAGNSLDLTGDRAVTHADAMEVSLEWSLAREALAPCSSELDLSRDVNRDGCIDVADLQQMAAASLTTAEALTSPEILSAGSIFVVNVVADGDDANIGNGICATAAGFCTLRAAIQEANAHAGPDAIHFNLGGGGLKTIQLKGKLPTLSDASGPTTIDGYTQPEAAPNTDPLVSNAAIRIQIAGNGETKHDGLTLSSAGNVIRGLALYRLKHAVRLFGSGATNNVLTGNFIGTDAAGNYVTPAFTFDSGGVHIEGGANRNRIGGATPAERNVISGNGQSGVGVWHEMSDANGVLNNLIGLNPAGTDRRPNRRHGVDLNFGAEANVIGGAGSGERNVISGNDYSGVEVSHTPQTTQNQIIGNFIGTDATGENAAWSYNGYTGITLEDGVSNNIIAGNVVGNNQQGGIQLTGIETQNNQLSDNRVGVSLNGAPVGNLLFGIRADGRNNVIGPNNLIAYNQFNGIILREDDKDFNRITRNSIYNNGALGIELLPNGVTPNDPEDADAGPNENLDFPVLQRAFSQWVAGTACAGCIVEIFIADRKGSAYGQGKTFVGSAVADGSGNFMAMINGVAAGDYVTATATDNAGNTSEFSLNLRVK